MKHSLTVAILFTLAALATLAVRAQAERQVASITGQGGATAPAAPVNTPPVQDGNALLAQAIHQARELTSVEAKVRMQTNILGQELSGTGSYYQLVRKPETLFKLELKLQVANQVSSLLHVSDGRFLWTRRDLPNNQVLARVDMRRVNEALVAAGRQPLPSSEVPMVTLGGLGHTLQQVANFFTFAAPRQESIGGVPVWIMEGTWRPEALASIWHDKAAAIHAGEKYDVRETPDYMPTQVLVVLARDPERLLFPQHIEYQRVSRAGVTTSLMALDYFDVRRNISLDPRLFAYKPGDQEVEDKTEEQLRSLGL